MYGLASTAFTGPKSAAGSYRWLMRPHRVDRPVDLDVVRASYDRVADNHAEMVVTTGVGDIRREGAKTGRAARADRNIRLAEAAQSAVGRSNRSGLLMRNSVSGAASYTPTGIRPPRRQ